jgi:hypothetical protein
MKWEKTRRIVLEDKLVKIFKLGMSWRVLPQ